MIVQPTDFDLARCVQETRINTTLANATDTIITPTPTSAFTNLFYLYLLSDTTTTILLKSNTQTIISIPMTANVPFQLMPGWPGIRSLSNGSGFQLRQDSGAGIVISAIGCCILTETLI